MNYLLLDLIRVMNDDLQVEDKKLLYNKITLTKIMNAKHGWFVGFMILIGPTLLIDFAFSLTPAVVNQLERMLDCYLLPCVTYVPQ